MVIGNKSARRGHQAFLHETPRKVTKYTKVVNTKEQAVITGNAKSYSDNTFLSSENFTSRLKFRQVTLKKIAISSSECWTIFKV